MASTRLRACSLRASKPARSFRQLFLAMTQAAIFFA